MSYIINLFNKPSIMLTPKDNLILCIGYLAIIAAVLLVAYIIEKVKYK